MCLPLKFWGWLSETWWNFRGSQRGAFVLWRSTKGSSLLFYSLAGPKECGRGQKRIPIIRNQDHDWIRKALFWLCPLFGQPQLCYLPVSPQLTLVNAVDVKNYLYYFDKNGDCKTLSLSEKSFFFNSLFGGRHAHSTPLEPPSFIPSSWSVWPASPPAPFAGLERSRCSKEMLPWGTDSKTSA